MSGLNVLNEFLDDRPEHLRRATSIYSRDDVDLIARKSKSSLIVSKVNVTEIEATLGYLKKNGSVKYRYVFSKVRSFGLAMHHVFALYTCVYTYLFIILFEIQQTYLKKQ